MGISPLGKSGMIFLLSSRGGQGRFLCQRWHLCYSRELSCDAGMFEWVKFPVIFTTTLSEITDCRQLQPPQIPQGLQWDVRQPQIPGYHSWEVRNLTETVPGTLIPSFVVFFFLPSCATKKPLRTPRANTTRWRMLWTLSTTGRSLMTSAVYVHLHS